MISDVRKTNESIFSASDVGKQVLAPQSVVIAAKFRTLLQGQRKNSHQFQWILHKKQNGLTIVHAVISSVQSHFFFFFYVIPG